jgi:putative N-acetyltransferase (TIGR04045 family)
MRSELPAAGSAAPIQVRRHARTATAGIECRRACSANERAHHLTIRHQIFVDEQAVFSDSDLDLHDGQDSTIAVLGYSDRIAVGTVRLFPLDLAAGRWQGDRLAVLPPYRTLGVGAPLVRYAVATAAAIGGRVMTAHIQPANVIFFERLGWAPVGRTEIYAGLPHQPMSIDLPSHSEALASLARLEDGITGRGPSRH